MGAEGRKALGGRVPAEFRRLQDAICAEIERLDGRERFREDVWDYAELCAGGRGGGASRVIREGAVFEKGGVNFSSVRGDLPPALAERLRVEPQPFRASGISLVLHPRSPMVPTVHLNLRYLEMLGPRGEGGGRAWFGGGADLTPYYLFEEDAVHFHRCLRAACESRDATSYARFKRWCDEYFHLPHRGEARGVGGIFFDYLDREPERTFAFVRGVGAAFLEAYLPIVERRRDEPWSEAEREWQLVRRGRYVEFNLIHDRGTLFGLETGGRAESILISLPPLVRWDYGHAPRPGSREEALVAVLRVPRDWLGG